MASVFDGDGGNPYGGRVAKVRTFGAVLRVGRLPAKALEMPR